MSEGRLVISRPRSAIGAALAALTGLFGRGHTARARGPIAPDLRRALKHITGPTRSFRRSGAPTRQQGDSECARRRRQIAAGQITVGHVPRRGGWHQPVDDDAPTRVLILR
jgi:hypothetical protein